MKSGIPCAIYTRKSSEEGLEQDFNSLHAQREACLAYIQSQKGEGWKALSTHYDDGGFSGGNLERPSLKGLLEDIAAGKVKIIVVYKVDRLTRSLTDFAKLVEAFDAQGVSFVSVTQQFNTTTSMGRLTLNVLLSFAQFEREVTGERIRDKIAASKKKGMWMGGYVPMGYRAHERTLLIDEEQADRIRTIYRRYVELGNVRRLKAELDSQGWATPISEGKDRRATGGKPFSRGHLYRLLSNPIYRGEIVHKGVRYPGQHPAIIDPDLWDQVQTILDINRQGRRKGGNPSRSDAQVSLLAGKLYDGDGQRMTPSHTSKGSRRYRYYVSTHLNGKPRQSGMGLRLPAPELEGAVLSALQRYLENTPRLLSDHTHLEAQALQGLPEQARTMRKGLEFSNLDLPDLLDTVLGRLVVTTEELSIELKADALAKGGHPICIVQPVTFRRCGFGIRMVIPGPHVPSKGRVDERLINLVKRGQGWFQRLVQEGKGPRVIAQEEGCSETLVQQMIYLSFLAPDIVQRIEAGEQPAELTSKTLYRALPLPPSWDAQRQQLGFT